MRLRQPNEEVSPPVVSRVRIAHRADLLGAFTDIVPAQPGAVLSLSITLGNTCTDIRSYIGEDIPLKVLINGDLDQGVIDKVARGWMSESGVRSPLVVEIACSAPRGSGLGTSSQLAVGSIAAMAAVVGITLPRGEMARQSYVLENRLDDCGWQDQAPLVAGGLMFAAAGAARHVGEVRPCYEKLPVGGPVIAELERRTLLAYTGASHFSCDNLMYVIHRIKNGDAAALRAWERLRALATQGRALLLGNDAPGKVVDQLSSLVAANWHAEIELTDGAVEFAALTALVPQLRGLGDFKLLGAGGGGHLWFIARSLAAKAVARAILEAAGMPTIAWETALTRAQITRQ